MWKTILNIISDLLALIKGYFSPGQTRHREEREIKDEYERDKQGIDNAIVGNGDINAVTDDMLDDSDLL